MKLIWPRETRHRLVEEMPATYASEISEMCDALEDRVAELERELAWVRRKIAKELSNRLSDLEYWSVRDHIDSKPPVGWKPQSELDKAARNETEFAKPFVLPKSTKGCNS